MPNFVLGKYAVYIVPAYAIAGVVIAAMIANTLVRAAHWRREVDKREALLKEKTKA